MIITKATIDAFLKPARAETRQKNNTVTKAARPPVQSWVPVQSAGSRAKRVGQVVVDTVAKEGLVKDESESFFKWEFMSIDCGTEFLNKQVLHEFYRDPKREKPTQQLCGRPYKSNNQCFFKSVTRTQITG